MKGPRLVNASGTGPRAGHTRWLYGLNAVARRLEVNPRSILEVHLLARGSGRLAALAQLAAGAQIPLHNAEPALLRRLTGTDSHQGVAALAKSFQYADLEQSVAKVRGPCLILDHIQDPHNLGALVRTAAAVGMAAVIIPRHGAAGVTPSVEKVAAGAVNDVAICRVTNLCRSLLALRARGYWSIALVPRGAPSVFEIDLPSRPVLVLGGETGLGRLVEETCDLRASIPVRGAVESLNAAVAGAIGMYEILRRGEGRQLDRL